jgi:hypothetical protein
VDSSGLEEGRRSGYYTWRLKERIRKRDFRKFHVASECRLPEKVIYAWRLTSPRKGDSPLFVELVGKVPGELGAVCADTAYCSRHNAQSVVDLGGTPFLKPRKDATALAKGYPGYRRMILHYKRKRSGFERVYHERSNGESTNSSFKRLWGSRLYSRKRWNQCREVGLKVVAHNLCLLLRFRVRVKLEKEVS